MSGRSIRGPQDAAYLIPLLDLANHRQGSPHHLSFSNSEDGGLVFQLLAGEDVAAGEEVGGGGGRGGGPEE